MIPLRIMETCDTLVGNVKDDNKSKRVSSNRQSKNLVNDSIAKTKNSKTNTDKQTQLLSAKEATVESSLDDVPVEACLEYLTRPHTSWRSVVKLHEQRKARITNHSLSVYSRSKAATRRSSFASQLSLDTSNNTLKKNKSGNIDNNSDMLWNSFASFQSVNSVLGSECNIKSQSDKASCASSVCTAPAQINSSYNINKSNKGKLWRGRRMIPTSSNNFSNSASSSSFTSHRSAVLSVNGAKVTQTSLPLESSTSLTVTGLTACNGNSNPSVSNNVHETGSKSSINAKAKEQQQYYKPSSHASSRPQLQKPGVLRSNNYLPPLPPSRLQSSS